MVNENGIIEIGLEKSYNMFLSCDRVIVFKSERF